jgi:hypothetical protein
MGSVTGRPHRQLDPEAVARAQVAVAEHEKKIGERGWPRRVDWATAREIAVAAQADPRTVQRELATPNGVGGMVGQRVRKALRERYGEGKVEG